MIKFRIHLKNLEGKEVLKNVKIIGFFDIFLDILHKMKENLRQEHVKRCFYPFREKIGTISPALSGKMTVFPVLTLLFHPSLSKIWLFHLNKNLFLK